MRDTVRLAGPGRTVSGPLRRMQRLGIDTNSPQFSAALKACRF
jgi:hypothetical protein